MDCYEPVDDYCDAWQPENLRIPETINPAANYHRNLDQFFIVLEVEKTYPLMNDDEEEVLDQFVEIEGSDFFTFWASCPRLEHENLSKDTISGMLSRAGVPLHKQEYMVERISGRADEIANADCNKDRRVLPMLVSISVVACLCYAEMSICDETTEEKFGGDMHDYEK
ncbi:UNVERIFIED_CONTAM: hypothetical protein Sindi_0543900 [Sesamum indicum]